MTTTDLLIIGLATWQAIEIWHHSHLFAEQRAVVELYADRWWAGPLLCPFCLGPWTALAIATPVYAGYALGDWGWVLHLPVLTLAATRVAQLGNDLMHRWNRTPKEDGFDR